MEKVKKEIILFMTKKVRILLDTHEDMTSNIIADYVTCLIEDIQVDKYREEASA